MGVLLAIDPDLHFPVGQVFRIEDEFNGRRRGTYYFRSVYNGHLRGPFLSETMARISLHHEYDDGA
jgi:hypothetical protein